jgi:hypothetical protein
MTDLLIPSSINIYLGVSAAGLFWTINEFVGTTVACVFVKKSKVASESVNTYLSEGKTALIHSITVPLNVALIYFTNLITFLASSWQWVLVGLLLISGSFVLQNFQQEIIVVVDYAYESLYPVVFYPLKSALNLLFVVFEIVVSLFNFISQYTSSVLIDTTKQLAACPGYLPSFYSIFAEFATTIYTFVLSIVNWVTALRQYTSIVGETTPLDMRTPFQPLRIIAYDTILRFQCVCPADRGFLDIVTIGIINPVSTVLDDLVHYSVNSVLSIVQAVLESVIAAATSGKYYPPATDNIVNNFEGLTIALQDLLNQLFINLVNFVQFLIQLAEGSTFNTWTAIPIFSIPGSAAIFVLECARLILRTVVNVPGFFIGSKLASQTVAIATPYSLADTTGIYNAALGITNAVFLQNLGAIYPPITNATGFFLMATVNVPLAYAQFFSVAASRFAFGRDVTNGTRFVTPFTGSCTLPTNTVFGKGFTNIWSGVYDVMGEYDLYVTNAYYNMAYGFELIFAKYYPPLGVTGNLGIVAAANYVSMNIRKTVYVINALVTLSPPNYMCYVGLERPTRIAVDNLLDSLPDFLEFFLNIPMAQAAENAHLNCKEFNYPNYIMSGSLKAPYFAAKQCNTLYVDNTLVSCPFPNNSSCPQYSLPYLDINANLLCAVDELGLTAVKAALDTERLGMQYAEKTFIVFLACIIAPSNTVTCPVGSSQSQMQMVSLLGLLGCNQWRTAVQIGNIVGDFLGIGFYFAYKYFYGYSLGPQQTAVYPQNMHQISFNGIDMSGPDLATFFQDRQLIL